MKCSALKSSYAEIQPDAERRGGGDRSAPDLLDGFQYGSDAGILASG